MNKEEKSHGETKLGHEDEGEKGLPSAGVLERLYSTRKRLTVELLASLPREKLLTDDVHVLQTDRTIAASMIAHSLQQERQIS